MPTVRSTLSGIAPPAGSSLQRWKSSSTTPDTPPLRSRRNSHAYRPLGLGFSNLGALLMSMGLPYDSDEGRGVAGALMAIMNGEAYAQARLRLPETRAIGPFEGFARKPRADARGHADASKSAVDDIDDPVPVVICKDAAAETWERCCFELGEERTATGTLRRPCWRRPGTISFMMDCDTTGIEPDIALVKYKLLAGKGDGMLKIVNQTVPDGTRQSWATHENRAGRNPRSTSRSMTRSRALPR